MKYPHKKNPRARTSTLKMWRRLFKRMMRKESKNEIAQRMSEL